MIKKIEDFIFSKNYLPVKQFITNFCKSPNESPAQLIYITGKTSTGKTDLLNIFGTELLLNKSTTTIVRVETNDMIQHFLKSLAEDNPTFFLNCHN
jgi:chromosomal replication initiation ATPase DnaA